MEFRIEEMTSMVSPSIRARGYSYFLKGNVAYFTESKPGKWQAVVEGENEYEVSVEEQDGTVQNYHCNCPFDEFNICKHIVAVVYAIAEELERRDFAETTLLPQAMKSLPQEDVEFVRSWKEMNGKSQIQFLVNYARNHPEFREAFLKWKNRRGL